MIRTLTLAAALISMSGATAIAETYPSRQITLIVPFAVGGPTDNVGRAFADAFRRQLPVPIVVENKPGAGGLVATRAVMSSGKPDGYTLLVGSVGPLVISPAAGATDIDFETKLTTIGMIAKSPQLLVASPALKASTLLEFIALAKANAGKLNYGSGGTGTTPHLAGELLKVHAGIDMLHVPYRGTGASLPDLISGRNQINFADITSVVALVKSGKLKAFAVTSKKRSPLVPDVPTTAEAGMPKLVTRNWNGLFGPAGLPKAVVAKVTEAMSKAADDKDYRENMEKRGASPTKSFGADFVAFIKEERDNLAPVVKASGLKIK